MKHVRYDPFTGKVNCYHCAEQYQVTPCSPGLGAVILKRFGKEHRRCEETDEGKALLAEVIKSHEGKELKVRIGPSRPFKSIGEKLAWHLQMQEMKRLGVIEDDMDESRSKTSSRTS